MRRSEAEAEFMAGFDIAAKQDADEFKRLDARIAELEAALRDAYPFVCVAVDRWRRDSGADKLNPAHAGIADRIARLTGHERMPSEVLVK